MRESNLPPGDVAQLQAALKAEKREHTHTRDLAARMSEKVSSEQLPPCSDGNCAFPLISCTVSGGRLSRPRRR